MRITSSVSQPILTPVGHKAILDIQAQSGLKLIALAAKTSGGIGCRGFFSELQARGSPFDCDAWIRSPLSSSLFFIKLDFPGAEEEL